MSVQFLLFSTSVTSSKCHVESVSSEAMEVRWYNVYNADFARKSSISKAFICSLNNLFLFSSSLFLRQHHQRIKANLISYISSYTRSSKLKYDFVLFFSFPDHFLFFSWVVLSYPILNNAGNFF